MKRAQPNQIRQPSQPAQSISTSQGPVNVDPVNSRRPVMTDLQQPQSAPTPRTADDNNDSPDDADIRIS